MITYDIALLSSPAVTVWWFNFSTSHTVLRAVLLRPVGVCGDGEEEGGGMLAPRRGLSFW